MIGLPLNDRTCLGTITQAMADRVEAQDPEILAVADRYAARGTQALAAWIRTLPQRDDDGDPSDGPKVEACEPAQRLRVPAPDPNCVERAALYLAVAEIIDPAPVRQLATIDTPMGMHTLPVENGAPIVLDPTVPRNCASCGLAVIAPGPVALDPREVIEWSARIAEEGAGTTYVRNGASRVRKARNAVMRLVNDGIVPAPSEVEAMGWMFALADFAAHRYGSRAISMVRTLAHAVAEVLDEVLARSQRNIALEIGGLRLEPSPWMSALASVAGHVGLDLGAAALRTKLASMGIGDDLVGLVEEELNNEGLTLGVFAHPPKLTTFASIQKKAA